MRLNLGAGGQIVQGWVNIDRAWPDDLAVYTDPHGNQTALDLDDADLITHDLAEPLPFADATASCAVAHHVLDLLEELDVAALCHEVARVLEPGGVWRISNVDYRNAIAALVQRDLDYFRKLGVPDQRDAASTFMWYLEWGGARKTVLYCPEQLGLEYLEPAGFKWEQVDYHVTTTKSGSICELDSREDESWFLEATKS